MHKSQVVSILKSLDEQEAREFLEFVHSPIHNKSPLLRKFAEQIVKKFPDFEGKHLKKENLYKMLFPGTTYRDYSMRTLATKLKSLLESYLAWKEFQADELLEKRLLIDTLLNRRLSSEFNRKLKSIQSQISEVVVVDELQLFHQFRESEISYVASVLDIKNRIQGNELEDVVERLDAYYLLNKLKYACSAVNTEKVLNQKINIYLMKEVRSFMIEEDNFKEKYPTISVFHQLYELLIAESNEAYFQLKSLLEENWEKLPIDDLNNIHIAALNFANRRRIHGDPAFDHELFQIYSALFDRVLLKNYDFVSPHHVKNMVTIALEVHEFDWTEEFMKRASEKLNPEFRKSVVAYNEANLAFFRGNYSKVIESLFDLEFLDVYYNLDYRKLMIKTYYELKELDPLEAALNSCDQYLRNNQQLTEVNKKSYLAFVSGVKKMLRIIYGGRRTGANLIKDFEKASPLKDKEWLIEKAKSISNF